MKVLDPFKDMTEKQKRIWLDIDVESRNLKSSNDKASKPESKPIQPKQRLHKKAS
jgi:hypothetical protein